MTFAEAPTIGEVATIDGQSSEIAAESRAVNVTVAWERPSPTVAWKDHDHICSNGFELTLYEPLALWPSDTIVVTAAIPITTPKTVRLARILFLASARKATRSVRNRLIALTPSAASARR